MNTITKVDDLKVGSFYWVRMKGVEKGSLADWTIYRVENDPAGAPCLYAQGRLPMLVSLAPISVYDIVEIPIPNL